MKLNGPLWQQLRLTQCAVVSQPFGYTSAVQTIFMNSRRNFAQICSFDVSDTCNEEENTLPSETVRKNVREICTYARHCFKNARALLFFPLCIVSSVNTSM